MSGMSVVAGVVPVGVDSPFGHASVLMGPDDFLLSIDGFSGDLRPALVGAITNAAIAMSDVIKGAITELNPAHV